MDFDAARISLERLAGERFEMRRRCAAPDMSGPGRTNPPPPSAPMASRHMSRASSHHRRPGRARIGPPESIRTAPPPAPCRAAPMRPRLAGAAACLRQPPSPSGDLDGPVASLHPPGRRASPRSPRRRAPRRRRRPALRPPLWCARPLLAAGAPSPCLRPLSGESLRRDPGCIEIRAKNPRSGGPISTKSPSFPCFKFPCSSCRSFVSVAPFWAYSISKCSSQRAHHFISLHHFHLSSS